MDVPDAKRLRALESENAKLKRMLAEAMLDNDALKVAVRGVCAVGQTAPALALRSPHGPQPQCQLVCHPPLVRLHHGHA